MTYETEKENMLSFIYIYRNQLNALLGDDPEFTIYEINEPLPDGTIEKRKDGCTLNIVCSNVVKLTIARDHIGDMFEDGEKLYIDYYYGRTNGNSVSYSSIKDRPAHNGGLNTQLDIAMLFEGNPHFSKFYSGWGQMGPWYCVAFKPELIQYHNDDAMSLHGFRSCAMEDIARDIFLKEEDEIIRFGTEMLNNNLRPVKVATSTSAVNGNNTWATITI